MLFDKDVRDFVDEAYRKTMNKEGFLPHEIEMLKDQLRIFPQYVIHTGELARENGMLLPKGEFYDEGIMQIIGFVNYQIGILLNNVNRRPGSPAKSRELGLAMIVGTFPVMQFTQHPVCENYDSRECRERKSLDWSFTRPESKGAMGTVEIGSNNGHRTTHTAFMRPMETYANNPGYWRMLEKELKVGLFGRQFVE